MLASSISRLAPKADRPPPSKAEKKGAFFQAMGSSEEAKDFL